MRAHLYQLPVVLPLFAACSSSGSHPSPKSGTRKARAVGAGLGSTVCGFSLLTDYRMSLFKLIPIEVHERLDYAVALVSLSAPFALGYAKKDRAATRFAVGAGLGAIAMLTDYRAAKGIPARRGTEVIAGSR